MFANSIHTIDLMRVFARGKIRSVRPIIPWIPERPSTVVAHVDFDSGDVGLYEGIWNGPGPWAVQVSTSQQLWELRPLEQAAVQRRGTRVLIPQPPDPSDVDFKPGVRRQAEAAANIAVGGPPTLPTLADGLETMRLIQAIFEPIR
jgi:predicted dehydrogenase